MHRVELLVFGFVFAPKVPSMGSLGREPEVLWDPYHFSLWRRLFGVGGKAGVCGFAAWGNFVGGLPPFRWPLPWPLPIAALLGRGIRSALLRGGILLAACRHCVGLSPGPSPSLRFWRGEFGRLCLLVGFCVRVGCEPRDRMKTFLQNRIFQAEVCIHAHAHSALTRRACGPRRAAGRQKSREIVNLLPSFTPPGHT